MALPAHGSVVVTQLSNQQGIIRHPIHDPVLVVDPTRPIAGETMLERFGLAGSRVGIAHDFPDEAVDALEHLTVDLHPVLVIVPGVR